MIDHIISCDLYLLYQVTGLDLAEKKVKVGEESFSYDKLLIATGSK